MELASTIDELAQYMLVGLDHAALQELSAFVGELLKGSHGDDELLQIWLSTPADVVFYNGADVRKMLVAVRDYLARQVHSP